MKLDVHLGAHKTASTHFQKVMERNKKLYESNAYYVPMREFRDNVTHANAFMDERMKRKVDEYLKKLKEINSQKLIISEENIIGEAKDIYNSEHLYFNARVRLERIKEFVSGFDEINIWVVIRSMDEFIPSLYCESLLHWKYRDFKDVLVAKHDQSWLPLINLIKETYPGAKINVIDYKQYGVILPKWLNSVTGARCEWDLGVKSRPRKILNHLSVRIFGYLHWFIPPPFSCLLLNKMSNYLYRKGVSCKYTPFNDAIVVKYRERYKQDIKEIGKLGGEITLFGS